MTAMTKFMSTFRAWKLASGKGDVEDAEDEEEEETT